MESFPKQMQRLGGVTERPGGLPRREHADEVVDERPVVGHAACEFLRMKTEQGIRLVVEHGLAAEAVFGTEQSRRFGDSAAHRGCVHVEMEEESGAAEARPACESNLGLRQLFIPFVEDHPGGEPGVPQTAQCGAGERGGTDLRRIQLVLREIPFVDYEYSGHSRIT
ncbi:hypothetical protein [Streptomyces chrestomyceticus]|uniref:hypothetical protein n=1 Tax=Streptomyces chrestomyceticus TaxID=68185 RepID=UPI0037B881F2